MQIDSEISTRISILRFVMIFGIVILHTPLYVPIDEVGPDAFDMIKAFFQSAVFRCTVPVLTLISGYLLFNSTLPQRPKVLVWRKFKSLVIPFLIFNLPLVAATFALQSFSPLAISYQLVPFNLGTWADAVLSLSAAPLNYPLYFLRDLFVLCLLSPIFAVMLRRAPLPGLILVGLIFMLNLDGWLVIRTDMPVTFYFGGLCAVRQVNLRRFDRHAPACLGLFLALSFAVVAFKVRNTTGLRLIAPMLVWPAASLLVGTRFGTWMAGMGKYSFFIFLMHAPIVMATWMVYSRYGAALPYPLYWISTPLFTTALLMGTYRVCKTRIPTAFAWARGVAPPRSQHGKEAALPSR
ncbi:MAG TPA: acyltransferase [Telluria sp.]|nr:acyltransferase [Telluria sp.]